MNLKKIFGAAVIAASVSGCASTGGVYDYTGASTLIGGATGGLIAREISNGDRFATGVGVVIGGAVGNMIGGATRNPCVTSTGGVTRESIHNGRRSHSQTTETRVRCDYRGSPQEYNRPLFR